MSAAISNSASAASSTAPSSRERLAGRILSGIAIAFLVFDVGIKLAGVAAAVKGTVDLGYQAHHLPIIGAIGLVCLILYVIPRTAPLGAILWTGYLGGAVATNLRVDAPVISHTLFPIYVAAVIWGGLYLRGDSRVRALIRPAR